MTWWPASSVPLPRADGPPSERGRAVWQRVEALSDDLAAKPHKTHQADELAELKTTLEPLATLVPPPRTDPTRARDQPVAGVVPSRDRRLPRPV